MAQGKRNRLSTEQRIDMWRRWKAGESLHEIGRAFGKRSEEHTSELQSLTNLVCRLLLEKKNADEEDCQNLIFRRAPRPAGARHHLIFRHQTAPSFRPVCAKPRRRTRAFSGRSQPVFQDLF